MLLFYRGEKTIFSSLAPMYVGSYESIIFPLTQFLFRDVVNICLPAITVVLLQSAVASASSSEHPTCNLLNVVIILLTGDC